MEGEDVNLGIYPYPRSYAASLDSGDGFGYANDGYLGILSIIHPISVLALRIIAATQNPYERWEEPFRGFPGPSVGSGESSLAGTLGERKTQKREDSNFYYGYQF